MEWEPAAGSVHSVNDDRKDNIGSGGFKTEY